MSAEQSEYPLAYLITFHTYASWLHGNRKGSVDRDHNRPTTDLLPPNKPRERAMALRSVSAAVRLSKEQRACVEQAIIGVCEYKGWELQALHARTNHVHAVVTSSCRPERIMNAFKSWATRALRERGLVEAKARVWSRHGSTRYLWDAAAVHDACVYVVEGQGKALG